MKDDSKINFGDDGTQCTLTNTGTCGLFQQNNCKCTITCINDTNTFLPLLEPNQSGSKIIQGACAQAGQGPNCLNITLKHVPQSTGTRPSMFPSIFSTPNNTTTINYKLVNSPFISLNSSNLKCNPTNLVISYDSTSCLSDSDKDCSSDLTLDMNLLPNNLSNISYLSVTSGTSDPIDPSKCTPPSSKSVEYYELLSQGQTARKIKTLIFSSGAIPTGGYDFTKQFLQLTTLDLTRSTGTGSDGFDNSTLPPNLTAITLPDIPSIDYELSSVPASAKITLSNKTTTFNPTTFTKDVITKYTLITPNTIKQITTLDLTATKSTPAASTTLTTLDGFDFSVLTSLKTLLLPSTLTSFNPKGLPTTLTSLTMPKSVTSFSLPPTNGITDLTITDGVTSGMDLSNATALESLTITGGTELTLDLSNATALTSLTFPYKLETFAPQGLPMSLTSLSISSFVTEFIIPPSNGLTDLIITDGIVFTLDISTAINLKTLELPETLNFLDPIFPTSLQSLCLENTNITDFSFPPSLSTLTTLKLPTTLQSLNLKNRLPSTMNVYLCSAPSLTSIEVDDGSGKQLVLYTNDSNLKQQFVNWTIKDQSSNYFCISGCNKQLCYWGGYGQLCQANNNIRLQYKTYRNQIQTLYTLSNGKNNKDELNLLIDIFSDFLTLYTDCSVTVKFKNKDFCTTIRWGPCPFNINLKNSNLHDLLINGGDGVNKFKGWDTLYEPNFQAMLFNTTSKAGTQFISALATLKVQNPFLDSTNNYLCTGVQNMDPSNTTISGPPVFNFDTNFNTIFNSIKTIINNN